MSDEKKIEMQRDLLLSEIENAIKVSESLAEDDEYCKEWQAVMNSMRYAAAIVRRDK